MTEIPFQIGTVEASEALLKDLYLDLRTRIRAWSLVTQQTPQARMGYIGQHLVSVVTGFPGGRSGARGHDLVLPDGGFAEIKTCYRVDQLGSCAKCGIQVSSVEVTCPSCDSGEIVRKDDSKWLIGVKNEKELRELFEPRWYYLVLFDFSDISSESHINARIWRVSPRTRGFAYCMVDYFFNIKSSAPFNLWPFMLKFYLMKPELIYHSVISTTGNEIETLLFEGKIGSPTLSNLQSLDIYARARNENLSEDDLHRLISHLKVKISGTSKKALLINLETERRKGSFSEDDLVEGLSQALYAQRITSRLNFLPQDVPRPSKLFS